MSPSRPFEGHDQTPAQDRSPGRVGRDLWAAGRVARILAGILFLAASFGTAVTFHLISPAGLLGIAGTVVVAAVVYTIGTWALADRLLARTDPWLAALALVLPLAVVAVLPVTPPAISVGLDAYIAISLLTQAVTGYGGCEIAGIPALVLRRRFTVYCALNGVDLVDRWLQSRGAWLRWTLAILAFLLTAVVITLVAETVGNLGYWIAYLLFLVAGWVVSRVWRARAVQL
jgi:hypothetical protein